MLDNGSSCQLRVKHDKSSQTLLLLLYVCTIMWCTSGRMLCTHQHTSTRARVYCSVVHPHHVADVLAGAAKKLVTVLLFLLLGCCCSYY